MKQYRHFTLDYKQRIVQEIETGQRSKSAIAREENLSGSLIDRWQKKVRDGTLIDHASLHDRQLIKENDWLKRKVAEQAMEIDLLKKIEESSARMRRSNGYIVTGRTTESRKDVRS